MSSEFHRIATSAVVSFIVLLATAASASAQAASDFYAAKPSMRLIVSSTPGGGYDLFGRLVARYITRHLPGKPQMVVQNMPGGGGVTATNYLYNIAPKDGTTMALIDRGVPTAELLYGRDSNAQFDIRRLNWVGSISKEIGVGLISNRAKARTVQEFKQREVVLGSNGLETDSAMYARLFNSLLGTKFKVVVGYPGQTEYYLAMTRGETDGLFMSGWSGPNKQNAVRDFQAGDINYFVQMAAQPNPEFGNTPTIMDLLTDSKDRQVVEVLLSRLDLGRPLLAPPNIPDDRVDLLRNAFRMAAQDPEMIREAEQSGNKIDPVFGEEAQATIKRLYATPPETMARIRSIVSFSK
jgi:tripartite-type tricarboxylate transporter receptor subunit TctC